MMWGGMEKQISFELREAVEEVGSRASMGDKNSEWVNSLLAINCNAVLDKAMQIILWEGFNISTYVTSFGYSIWLGYAGGRIMGGGIHFLFLFQPSERMKIVDVIGEKTFKDGERIIAQVCGHRSSTTHSSHNVRFSLTSLSA